MNFDAIREAMENNDRQEENVSKITLEVGTLSGIEKFEVNSGITVGEFKEENDLVGKKVVTEDGVILTDSTVLDESMTLLVLTPKENG